MDLGKKGTRSDTVYKKIYNAIMSGYFKPGQRLVERDIADILQVSRTPVREALKQLEKEKMVKTVPYRGVMVTRLSLKEARQVYEVRSNLEGLAVRLAATNVNSHMLEQLETLIELNKEALKNNDTFSIATNNNEFHRTIVHNSDNDLLIEILNSLWAQVNILRLTSWSLPNKRPQETLLEHTAIYEAIRDGDAILAEQNMIKHLDNARQVVLAHLAKEEGVF
ncbi:hypothetical protein SY88_12630 [Clostridiales bacterium PH28_bin88]|nr:hypothetical protein SY88_12630 [Clostridiales bacterium PH28_bin88]